MGHFSRYTYQVHITCSRSTGPSLLYSCIPPLPPLALHPCHFFPPLNTIYPPFHSPPLFTPSFFHAVPPRLLFLICPNPLFFARILFWSSVLPLIHSLNAHLLRSLLLGHTFSHSPLVLLIHQSPVLPFLDASALTLLVLSSHPFIPAHLISPIFTPSLLHLI